MRKFCQTAQVGVVVDGDGHAGLGGDSALEVLAAQAGQVCRKLVTAVGTEQPRRGDADRPGLADPPSVAVQQPLQHVWRTGFDNDRGLRYRRPYQYTAAGAYAQSAPKVLAK